LEERGDAKLHLEGIYRRGGRGFPARGEGGSGARGRRKRRRRRARENEEETAASLERDREQASRTAGVAGGARRRCWQSVEVQRRP
jgi:hypothetical protein